MDQMILYSGKLLREKTFVDGYEVNISQRKNLLER